MAGSPVRAQVSAVLLYFGYLLIAVGIFGMMHLLRRRAVALGHVAGVLAIWGPRPSRACSPWTSTT